MSKDQQVDHERFTKLGIARESPKNKEPSVPHNDSRNTPNPDDYYLKSIKLDVSTFDGCHDPQLFLNWIQQINRYFTWYPLSKPKKVKFAAMKLTDQASHYWTNVEPMREMPMSGAYRDLGYHEGQT